MDGNRFDNLTRRLGGTLTRRRAIASTLGLAAMSAGLADRASAARPCAGPGRNCTRNGDCCSSNCMRVPTRNSQNRLTCGCEKANEKLCDRACVDLDTDPRNCGACRNRCGSGQTCVAGRCTSAPTGPTGPTCATSLQDCTSLQCCSPYSCTDTGSGKICDI